MKKARRRRRNLWDLRFWNTGRILQRFFIYLTLFLLFSGFYFMLRWSVEILFSQPAYRQEYLPVLLALAFAVLLYRPLEKNLLTLIGRVFLVRRYDYQKVLRDASKGISNIKSLDHLFGLVIHFITMKMRIKSAAILTKQIEKNEYLLVHQRGYEKRYLEYRIPLEDPLIEYLQEEREAIDMESLEELIRTKRKRKLSDGTDHHYDYETIQARMIEMDAQSCIPSFLGQDLRNILVLGSKRSGEPYSDVDVNVLFTLAQESAIAIENARLFDEAIKKTQELEQINQQLQLAKIRLTRSLQETEKTNKQLQDAQVQLIHEQKMATLGRLAASVGHEVNNPLTILSMNVSRAIMKNRKNPELKVSEIMDMFQKMEHNINRIKAVVNTLTGLLKKSEKGKFEPLSLKLILEETLPLVQFQTYLDNLNITDVEFDIPGNIPLIRGDLERLQEVFLNLFINAYHAMAEKRNPKIYVKAEIAEEDPRMVAVHFKDNGSGMNEETMKKIFNYGFTTKPPGRGSGMGLYMCKYIIELHGGTIKVSSEIGKGTTFVLTIPVFDEYSITKPKTQVSAD